LKKLPDNTAIWLLGWQNSLLKENQQRLSSESQRISGRTAVVDKQAFDSDQHVVILLDSNNSRTPLGFIGADDPEDIALMARKLPHYSSYGVLAFSRVDANNIMKQHLPVQVSPMARQLTE
jgi:hypothetical protein